MIYITSILGAIIGHMLADFVAFLFRKEAHPVFRFLLSLAGATAAGFLFVHFNQP